MALFRRGDSFGDTIAKRVHKSWLSAVVELREYSLVFKDVNICQPAKFKAMACLLATKPCDHRHLQIQVCRFVLKMILFIIILFLFFLEKKRQKNLEHVQYSFF